MIIIFRLISNMIFNSSRRQPNLIFIVGTPRSGTTLIQAQLLRCDGFISTPETHFFSNLYSKRGLFSLKSKNHARLQIFKILGRRPRRKFSYSATINDFKETIEKFLELKHKSVFIEKTPMHLWHKDNIKAYFPESIFIHIIRNRYENVRSLYHVTNTYSSEWGGKRSLTNCNNRWIHDLLLHKKYINDKNTIYIDYGRFCSNIDAALARLGNILGATIHPFDPNLVEHIIQKNEKWKQHNIVGEVRRTNYGSSFMLKDEFERNYPINKHIKRTYREVLNNCIV